MVADRLGPQRIQLESLAAHAAIIGGRPAYGPRFASLAFIQDERGDVVGECTGTVVAPNAVLTAAHCVQSLLTGNGYPSSGFSVATDAVDLAKPTVQESRVSEVHSDPAFDDVTGADDAALLVLATPTPAPPIALDAKRAPVRGTTGYIAGWGVTSPASHRLPSQLRRAATIVQGATWCEMHVPRYSPRSEICAIDPPRYATGPCRGDSGGPLLVSRAHGTGAVEVGIVSRGSPTCSTEHAAVFTSVRAVDTWITRTLAAIRTVRPNG